MKIKKVLIVYKKSSYQTHALDRQDHYFLRLLRERNFSILRSQNVHNVHIDALEKIKIILEKQGIHVVVKHRQELKPIKNFDLVISVGGDGTFLEASHFLDKDGILLGVNSVPKDSVGYYCHATAETFEKKIRSIQNGTFTLKHLNRLQCEVDGVNLGPRILNDILFANRNPAGTTRYILKIGEQKEEQKSSGLWTSPAAGSTAATHSAGGKKIPLESRKFQYVVREPYAPPGKKYHLLKGILDPKQKVHIMCMMEDAYLYIDGPHLVYPIRRGNHIMIRKSTNALKAIW